MHRTLADDSPVTISGTFVVVGGSSGAPVSSPAAGLVLAYANSQHSGTPVAQARTTVAGGGTFVLHVRAGIYFVVAKEVSFTYPVRVDATKNSVAGVRIADVVP
jgi:hypothetical protein